MSADHYVFATGAWSSQLSAELVCKIPVEPGKGYSVTMSRPGISPRHPMLFPEHRVGVTPFDDSYRLGSMMEFSGFDSSIPPHRIQQLQDSAVPYLVEPAGEIIQETWYGWRPMTWDSLPIIGRVPALDNALLATGHNMLGLTLAPATGKLIAELIDEREPHIAIEAFSPSRF
jgi:D-amino-acid dehydrogenase